MVQTPLSLQSLYPDSDGKPMADNTLQYQWIVRLVENLKQLLQDEAAFVAGDLLWYPVDVKRHPGETPKRPPCQAPDAMVVFGRPDRYRGSYKQWQEDNIAPQVVFEILSPSNSHVEMAEKQRFYQKYGVEEMYFYDPQRQNFWGFARSGSRWQFVTELNLPWTSPRLNIRFEMFEDGLEIFGPDEQPFKTFTEVSEERDRAETRLAKALAKLQELGVDPESI